MTGNIVIFVTDQRQSNLAACLPGKIHRLDWRRGVEKEEALKVLDNSKYLVLPVPVTKIERNHMNFPLRVRHLFYILPLLWEAVLQDFSADGILRKPDIVQ